MRGYYKLLSLSLLENKEFLAAYGDFCPAKLLNLIKHIYTFIRANQVIDRYFR